MAFMGTGLMTPYLGAIPGGVHKGQKIHISGVPDHNSNGFSIALQAGASLLDARSECAFLINPRFNENQVVRNTLHGGNWGTEERHGGFPFIKGQPCTIVIKVKDDHYKVHVNGQHFCDYKHRTPMHMVSHITIGEGFKIQDIHFGDGSQGYPQGPTFAPSGGPMYNYNPGFPQPAPGFPQPAPGFPQPPMGPGPMSNFNVPYVLNIGGLYPNKMFYISGVPKQNPKRFSIYLQHGSEYEPQEIALVVDVRFNYTTDHNVIVRNHRQGNWGTEERQSPHFPFAPNAKFEMIILTEPNAFKIAVNNQHLLEFHHRIQPLSRVDTLHIDGDVVLTNVRMQN